MTKQHMCISLTAEERDVLREIARRNKMKMSQVIGILIMGNRDVRFEIKAKRG